MIRNNGSLMIQFVLATAMSCIVLLSGAASAADNIASIKSLTGSVHVLRKGALPAVAAKTGDQLSSGDIVRTKSDATAEVAFKDGSVLKISPRSRIDLGEYYDGQNKNLANVKLARGKVEAVVSKGTSGRMFEVQTPNAICGVRGTDWFESYDVESNITGVAVVEGSVYSYNVNSPANVVTVLAGTFTSIAGNAPPRPPAPGTGSVSGAVPFAYSGSSGGGSSSFSSLTSLMGAAMAASAPPPPPPPAPTPPQPAVQATGTQVNVNPSFN